VRKGAKLTGVYMLVIGSISGQGAQYNTMLKGGITDFDRGEKRFGHDRNDVERVMISGPRLLVFKITVMAVRTNCD